MLACRRQPDGRGGIAERTSSALSLSPSLLTLCFFRSTTFSLSLVLSGPPRSFVRRPSSRSSPLRSNTAASPSSVRRSRPCSLTGREYAGSWIILLLTLFPCLHACMQRPSSASLLRPLFPSRSTSTTLQRTRISTEHLLSPRKVRDVLAFSTLRLSADPLHIDQVSSSTRSWSIRRTPMTMRRTSRS